MSNVMSIFRHFGLVAGGSNLENRQLIIFSVAGEKFGADIMQVDSIINPTKIFKVPNVPCFIEGLINLRGKVYTVFNLSKRFNLPQKAPDENSRIVIVKPGMMTAGLVVDSVDEIIPVDQNDMYDISQAETNMDKKYFCGVAERNGRKVFILDLAQLLSAS